MRSLFLLIFLSYKTLFSCTGLFISNDEVKLLGLNEDFHQYDTMYYVVEPTAEEYGMVAFGHSNSIQAIINDKGLCYDGYGAPHKEVTYNSHLPESDGSLIFQAMRSCSSVDEVKDLFNQYFNSWMSDGQLLFTDRYGSSAIFEGDTIIDISGEFQVITNFYQSDPESGIPYGFYPSPRYDYLVEQLGNTQNYSIELVRDLLDDVHVENQSSPAGLISTVYSLVVDLVERDIYIYNLYNYDEVVVVNIDEEISGGGKAVSLEELFNSSIYEDGIDMEIDIISSYPNPFNPTTRIDYTVPKSGLITIKVYNQKGEEVISDLIGRKTEGLNSYLLNGSRLNSGVYMLKLMLDNDELGSKRVTLIK